MISRSSMRSTFETTPITVSMPISDSYRSCQINSPAFSPFSPTSKPKAQVLSISS
jgi:hypothetical protein